MAVTLNDVLKTRQKLENELLQALQRFEGATLCSIREISLEKMTSARGVDLTASVTIHLDLPDGPRKELGG